MEFREQSLVIFLIHNYMKEELKKADDEIKEYHARDPCKGIEQIHKNIKKCRHLERQMKELKMAVLSEDIRREEERSKFSKEFRETSLAIFLVHNYMKEESGRLEDRLNDYRDCIREYRQMNVQLIKFKTAILSEDSF